MPRVPQGRVILQGYVSGGSDIWTMSFATDQLDGRSQTQLEQLAEAVADIFDEQVWTHVDFAGFISELTAFTGVRVDDVQDPGGVVRTAQFDLVEPSLGASTGQQLPPQCSEVVSLRTGSPGKSFRGRMYFPPLSVGALTGEGSISTGAQGELADAMQRFFNTYNAASAPVNATAFVASDVRQQLTAINQIQVGSVFDTQRRRRSEIAEAYVSRGITL